jgi:hypothetical protein
MWVIRSEYMWVIHVGACVTINAKGGDCWQIQLKTVNAMLVIDSNNEDDRKTEDKFREVNDQKQ